MSIDSSQPLLTPIRLGGLELPNRVVMAPLTRMRAANAEFEPTALHAEYYAQRAAAGLIVSEGVFVSPEAVGWADVPGLWSDAQVRGWSVVTDAVHRAGGRIVAQLWHTGSLGHPDFHAGKPPLSASAVNPEQQSVTSTGRKDTVVPRPMEKDHIRRTVADFGRAAHNAIAAGFDGVQIQGGYHYLFNQFLNVRTNLRADEYGGSVENRARFLFEVLEAVVGAVGAQRTGIKTGPATSETGAFVSTDETLATSEYVIGRLNDYDLSHLLLMGAMADLSATPLAALAGDGMFRHFRELYRGNVIANVDTDRERGNRLIEAGLVDMVAFGRPFIANPDLPARFAMNAPLAEINWPKVYGPTAEGYTDYPAFQAVTA
ncbi:alkene reductase [Paraburkholderia sp. PGU19]|uniref:alkene reductase n=1 Tax=Paraburkholderia sp. PGU19 TaxID=2735434 RepID=UPI0015D9F1E6|nr:alkene reductase [Paraburkholderia sp. PGU19]BCG01202.1 alkene reductase [Paraburkholderia sp. PGU19]